MNNKILFLLILLLIPASQAEPVATSYWGYVTVDDVTKSNAQVKVLNSACEEVASATSTAQGYLITVPWEDAGFNQAGVKAGETIYFLVNEKLATSSIIDAKGSNNKLGDLTIQSQAAAYVCKSEEGNNANSGGSPASAETFENIVKQESREEMLSKDAPRTYSFSTQELPVSQIVITSNINAGLTNIRVELLKKRSALASADAPGNVYKYMNILVGSLGFAVPRNIKEGVVKFKVENSWITSNGFTDSDIKMLKWNGIEWITLATEKKSSDEKFTSYEAMTTSFSPFVISGVKETAASEISPEITAVPAVIQETPTPSPTKKAPGFEIVLALAGLTAVVLRKRS